MKTNLTKMKSIVATACCALSLSFISPIAAQNTANMGLEGKTFQITMSDRTGSQSTPDVISFNNRVFTSNESSLQGFAPTPYLYKPGGEMGDYFEVIITTDKDGTKRWAGYVKGNTISGGLIWEKPGQTPEKFPFTGTLASLDKTTTPAPADKTTK